MRIAVAGGTGQVGRPLVEALEGAGHEAVVLSRSNGVDLVSGEGLADKVSGADALVDVTSTAARDRAVEFFGTATEHLLTAERRAGVGHHVVLSIVGIDRIESNPHYAGKRRQEELVEAGPIPWTIVRATQFHDFAGMVASSTARDGRTTLAPLLVQPVAIDDVVELLLEVATAEPRRERIEIAGPRTEDLVDMARRTLAARGESIDVVPSWRGMFEVDEAGEVLLPGENARIARSTFDEWLASQRPS